MLVYNSAMWHTVLVGEGFRRLGFLEGGVMDITRKPVEKGACPKCANKFRGVLFRIQLSRLEEGLGHEGFRCDKCGYSVKYVPESHK